MAKCRRCHAEIVFLRTRKGTMMPVDAESVTSEDDIFNRNVHISHFATCPFAETFRKEKKLRKNEIT